MEVMFNQGSQLLWWVNHRMLLYNDHTHLGSSTWASGRVCTYSCVMCPGPMEAKEAKDRGVSRHKILIPGTTKPMMDYLHNKRY